MIYKNRLIRLPPEILANIFSFLTRKSLNQLSLVCHCMHDITLPTLYKTISLSFRTHIKQIELGIQYNNKEEERNLLKQTIDIYTKQLILKCKQSGQQRLLQDIRPFLNHHLPHLKILTLTDFHMLSINRITPLLSILPQLDKIIIHYSDLTDTNTSSFLNNMNANVSYFLHSPPEIDQQHQQGIKKEMIKKFNSITSLELHWTDFTKTSMMTLLSYLPSLTSIHLNANHNRYVSANNQLLKSIQFYCPLIKDLEIGLQEIEEETLAECIAFYGNQLHRLAIYSHGPLTLFAIAKHATNVKDLTIRFSLETKWYGYFNDNENENLLNHPNQINMNNIIGNDHDQQVQNNRQGLLNPIIHRLSTINELNQVEQVQQQQQQQQNNNNNNNNNNSSIEEKAGGLLDILYWCQDLVRVQVVSMYNKTETYQKENLPIVVQKALTIVDQRRKMKNDQLQHEQQQQYEKNHSLYNHNDKLESIDNVSLEQLASQSRGSFHIQPPNTSNGGAWIYHFDENMAREQYNNTNEDHRFGKSSLMEKILTFDNEQLHEIRTQFAALTI